MNQACKLEKEECFEELLVELIELFKSDPTDRLPARYVVQLLSDGIVSFEVAQTLYSQAIFQVYFSDSKINEE